MINWLPPPSDLELADREVHIWRIDLNLPIDQLRLVRYTLSEDERRRASRFYFKRDQDRYVAARAGLRDILGRYLGRGPGDLSFQYNRHGKPSLVDGDYKDCVGFNLSHSGDIALVAVVRGSGVGIDIERIRMDFTGEDIASRFFSPVEMKAIQAQPLEKRHIAFFSCWTRKESYIKARGEGLSIPLDAFDVSVGPDEPPRLLANRSDPIEVTRWSMFHLEPGKDYIGSLTAETGKWVLRYWRWELIINP
jgi:4'-phosphopantetheinyl transferase